MEEKPQKLVDEVLEDVGAPAPVMEAQDDDTRNYRSASANIPLLPLISILSTRARPKLIPHSLMSAEKVALHNLLAIVIVQIRMDMTVYLNAIIYATMSVSGKDKVLQPP